MNSFGSWQECLISRRWLRLVLFTMKRWCIFSKLCRVLDKFGIIRNRLDNAVDFGHPIEDSNCLSTLPIDHEPSWRLWTQKHCYKCSVTKYKLVEIESVPVFTDKPEIDASHWHWNWVHEIYDGKHERFPGEGHALWSPNVGYAIPYLRQSHEKESDHTHLKVCREQDGSLSHQADCRGQKHWEFSTIFVWPAVEKSSWRKPDIVGSDDESYRGFIRTHKIHFKIPVLDVILVTFVDFVD